MARENTSFQVFGYSYADVKIEFNGVELPEVTAFELNKTQSKTNNYGTGGNPTSRSRGIKEYSGSMEMGDSTAELLRNLASDGTLSGVPAGILVATLAAEDGSKSICTCSAFEFNGDGRGGSQGDDLMSHSVDTIFGSMAFTKI